MPVGGSTPGKGPGPAPGTGPQGPSIPSGNPSKRWGEGARIGYCEGLNLGRDVGQADGRNNNSAHALGADLPKKYWDILERHFPDLSKSLPDLELPLNEQSPAPADADFDSGFTFEFETGYKDGYSLGNAMGLAEFAADQAKAKNDYAGEAAANQSVESAVRRFTDFQSKYGCVVNISMAPSQGGPQQLQASGTPTSAGPASSSTPPEVQAALAQIWQQAQADGYTAADVADVADQGAEVAATAAEAEAAAARGADDQVAVEDANAMASLAEGEAPPAKGSADWAAQDAQTQAEDADSAASA